MELDTELHRGLGCRLSLHKIYLWPVATVDEAAGFWHRHQATTAASLFDLI